MVCVMWLASAQHAVMRTRMTQSDRQGRTPGKNFMDFLTVRRPTDAAAHWDLQYTGDPIRRLSKRPVTHAAHNRTLSVSGPY